jgi:biopolymer transport protein ExbB/TolQ
MLMFLRQCGVFAWPLLIIAAVNLVLIVLSVVRLAGRDRDRGAETLYGIHAILFWGGLAAALGFLGQHSGLYKALTVISRAQQISPSRVAQGFAESFTTTLLGMTILVISAVAWFALQAWYRRRNQGARAGRLAA